MLFSEEDAPQLKKWIVKRLENTYVSMRLGSTLSNELSVLTRHCHSSDADADVLADYVLALLRHDGDLQTVRRLCEEEIPDFLKEGKTYMLRYPVPAHILC